MGKSGSGESEEAKLKQIEGMVKSMGAAMSDGSAPILVVTIYRGASAPLTAHAIRDAIEQVFAASEVEVVEGGQALYPFIASVE